MSPPHPLESSPTLSTGSTKIGTPLPSPILRLQKYHRRVIENECSMARDQFAVERNFLSWFKLAMAVASSGAVIFREFDRTPKSQRSAMVDGAFTRLADISTIYFLCLSMVLLFIATLYLWDVKLRLARDKRPVRLFWLLFLSVAGVLAAGSLIFIVAYSYARMPSR
ncbi:hypothetical protein LPJ53_005631 [Coemansia erecta]|uniref:DUF202 domain-containing protein n=1 Tax=Coemansia erecta TaxID=147472 RepID=A0A9W7XWF2_9FUNG|nr:hypothetical protein LPJ53_005631 [Coemansia erecta]